MFRLDVSPALRLEFLREDDAPALFALTEANRERLRKWLPWVDDIRAEGDTLRFIQAAREAFLRSGCAACGVWADGRLAGVAGHNRIDRHNRTAYLGYWLGNEFTGRGLMTDSVRALVGHAFAALHLNKVVILVATGNARSQAIPDRLGFVREGVLRDGEQLYGRFVDSTVNGVLKRDWR